MACALSCPPVSASSGAFTPVACSTLSAIDGLEGPECYQLPNGLWCLICDQFKAHKGYLPIVINSLDTGDVTVLEEGSYHFGHTLKRHGGVLRIDDEAYDRLVSHYGL